MSMTDSAQNIAICNESLGLLGAEEITVGATTEQNHIYCTTFFDDARDEILVAHKWNFAKKRAFAIQTTDPLFGYDNAYTPPSDYLKIVQIEEEPDAEFEVENALILTDEGAAPSDWADETAYLVGEYITNDDVTFVCIAAHTSGDTDDEPGVGAETATYWTSQSGDFSILKVEYIYQHTTFSTWPIYAKQCLVLNLARMLSSPIKQDETVSLNLQAMLWGSKKVIGYLDTARSIDGMEGGAIRIKTASWLKARRTGRS
ncbi:hypothetical protein LCGC14_2199780 [marine sediment metagenome]|uniref:Uncharacterized protein n=1 Tax=marine sediment metagenome TaxID=412755 RepID=A0A0F9GCT6_9ZZZZ